MMALHTVTSEIETSRKREQTRRMNVCPVHRMSNSLTIQQYDFEDLLQHFSNKLTNLTLPTSSSMQNNQFIDDCLISLAKGVAHLASFFRKALKSLAWVICCRVF